MQVHTKEYILLFLTFQFCENHLWWQFVWKPHFKKTFIISISSSDISTIHDV